MRSMYCPACGAPVQIPFGRITTNCEYCGAQVRDQVTDAESNIIGKNRDFVEAVEAAITCIRNNDYSTALTYAEKAESELPSDPAPSLIRFVCNLDTNFNKSKAALSIMEDRMANGGSVAIDEDRISQVIGYHFMNYAGLREQDLIRMFTNIKRVTGPDINNLFVYEYNKRISDYVTIPRVVDAMKVASDALISEGESVTFSDNTDQSNWNRIKEFRKTQLYRVSIGYMLNKDNGPRAKDVVSRYSRAVDLKWEPSFKRGVDGSKDEVREYRREADALLYVFR